jgi:cyclophilin family peptidyl-prolyl cis-trans isomerase
MIRWILVFVAALCVLKARAAGPGTLVTMKTTVGTVELELYDNDKPITVSNFIKYITTGRFNNTFLQRWEPNFVIQAGGYFVTNKTTGPEIDPVPTFPEIPNEYSVGRPFSNIYGTIAMARRSGETNSASSQWFLNLTNNAFLDTVDGGFTVFGKLTSGSNVLDLFIPPPPTKGIYRAQASFGNPPVLAANPGINDLIYLEFKLRRDFGLQVHIIRGGARQVQWASVPNEINILETTAQIPAAWQPVTNFIGNGSQALVFDRTPQKPGQIYRVRVNY